MENLKDVSDWGNTVEFKDQYGEVYKKDNRARETLNKVLDTEFKAVFRSENRYKNQWKYPDIDWCGETIYIITHKNKLVSMQNSEWAFFTVEA